MQDVTSMTAARARARSSWLRATGLSSLLLTAALSACGSDNTEPPFSAAGSTGTTPTAGTGSITPRAGTGATAGSTSSPVGAAGSGAAGSGSTAAGAGAAAGSGAAGAGAATEPTFTAVLDILTDSGNCGVCHGYSESNPPAADKAGQGGGFYIHFTDPAKAYTDIVGPKAYKGTGNMCGDTGDAYVVPGQPDASLLYSKLALATPKCGMGMPYGDPMGLPAADLATIRAWITAGAPNN